MRSSPTVYRSKSKSPPHQLLRFVAARVRSDAAIMIGLPLLIAAGAILGIINLLALIHVIAVLIGS